MMSSECLPCFCLMCSAYLINTQTVSTTTITRKIDITINDEIFRFRASNFFTVKYSSSTFPSMTGFVSMLFNPLMRTVRPASV